MKKVYKAAEPKKNAMILSAIMAADKGIPSEVKQVGKSWFVYPHPEYGKPIESIEFQPIDLAQATKLKMKSMYG